MMAEWLQFYCKGTTGCFKCEGKTPIKNNVTVHTGVLVALGLEGLRFTKHNHAEHVCMGSLNK